MVIASSQELSETDAIRAQMQNVNRFRRSVVRQIAAH